MVSIVRLGLIFGVLFAAIGCGDGVVDTHYRGRKLFSFQGIIEPAQYLDGADLLCSEAAEVCAVPCFDEDDGSDDPDCYEQCRFQFEECLKKNKDESFTSAYYDNAESQRVAIIWADPRQKTSGGRVNRALIQQRSVISTGFPARYSVDLYQPPPVTARFIDGAVSYAYGIVVSFYDRNRDEALDIRTEPIIGFNPGVGVLYTYESSTGDTMVANGYRLVDGIGMCPSESAMSGSSDASDLDTSMIISGTTPTVFDEIADVDCDGEQQEWLSLCQASLYRSACAERTISPSYTALCQFCSGRWPAVSRTLREKNSPNSLDDVSGLEECDFANSLDQALCLIDRQYEECLQNAQTPEEELACERAFDQAQCEALAATPSDIIDCGEKESDVSEGSESTTELDPEQKP